MPVGLGLRLQGTAPGAHFLCCSEAEGRMVVHSDERGDSCGASGCTPHNPVTRTLIALSSWLCAPPYLASTRPAVPLPFAVANLPPNTNTHTVPSRPTQSPPHRVRHVLRRLRHGYRHPGRHARLGHSRQRRQRRLRTSLHTITNTNTVTPSPSCFPVPLLLLQLLSPPAAALPLRLPGGCLQLDALPGARDHGPGVRVQQQAVQRDEQVGGEHVRRGGRVVAGGTEGRVVQGTVQSRVGGDLGGRQGEGGGGRAAARPAVCGMEGLGSSWCDRGRIGLQGRQVGMPAMAMAAMVSILGRNEVS